MKTNDEEKNAMPDLPDPGLYDLNGNKLATINDLMNWYVKSNETVASLNGFLKKKHLTGTPLKLVYDKNFAYIGFFDDCVDIKEVVLLNAVISSDSWFNFENCKIEKFILGDGKPRRSLDEFSSISLDSTTLTLSVKGFSNNPDAEFVSYNPDLEFKDGCLIYKDKKYNTHNVVHVSNKAPKNLVLDDEIRTIESHAFTGNKSVKTAYGKNVNFLGAYAFEDSKVKTFDFPNLKAISNHALGENIKLTELHLKNKKVIIDPLSFEDSNIQNVYIYTQEPIIVRDDLDVLFSAPPSHHVTFIVNGKENEEIIRKNFKGFEVKQMTLDELLNLGESLDKINEVLRNLNEENER